MNKQMFEAELQQRAEAARKVAAQLNGVGWLMALDDAREALRKAEYGAYRYGTGE